MTSNGAAKIYEIVTKKLLERMQQGVIPWRKPWSDAGGGPRNLVSKRRYRGINWFILMCQPYSSPYWATFNQIRKLGGHVRKGEHGTPVILWRWLYERKNPITGKMEKLNKPFPLVRYFTVFNIEQCDGLTAPVPKKLNEFAPIEQAEQVVENMKDRPAIFFGGDVASYSPSVDKVQMPMRGQFHSAEEFYGTMFHELTHSTGHKSRLDRDDWDGFGTERYSREELVAEMGASFLMGFCGLEQATLDNSAAYLQSWLKKLTNEPELLITAAQRAQKAADFILGELYEEEEEEEEEA